MFVKKSLILFVFLLVGCGWITVAQADLVSQTFVVAGGVPNDSEDPAQCDYSIANQVPASCEVNSSEWNVNSYDYVLPLEIIVPAFVLYSSNLVSTFQAASAIVQVAGWPGLVWLCPEVKSISQLNCLNNEPPPPSCLQKDKKLWYEDKDGDGYGNKEVSRLNCDPPPKGKWVLNSSDCNDNNAEVWEEILVYTDADKDGFALDSAKEEKICADPQKIPEGKTKKKGDCNDADRILTPELTWQLCLDMDGDLWPQGPETKKLFSSCDLGYQKSGTKKSINYWPYKDGVYWAPCNTPVDCDDTDPNAYPKLWYPDWDGDGEGNAKATSFGPQCERPPDVTVHGHTHSFVPNKLDCKDDNPLVHSKTKWLPDVDGDGYSGSYPGVQAIIQCHAPNKTGYAYKEGDCDDSNKQLNPTTRWYQDNDGDGYGRDPFVLMTCEPTEEQIQENGGSLILKGGDCDDSKPEIKDKDHTHWYVDLDGDGDGWSNASNYSEKACRSTDIKTTLDEACVKAGYLSSEFPDLSVEELCAKHHQTLGWSLNTDDCDSEKANITAQSNYFLDVDGDGFGDKNKKVSCTEWNFEKSDPEQYSYLIQSCYQYFDLNLVPEMTAGLDKTYCDKAYEEEKLNVVTKVGDCHYFSEKFNPDVTWYPDIDGDGFGNNLKAYSCMPPMDPADLARVCVQTNFASADCKTELLEICQEVKSDFLCKFQYASKNWVTQKGDCNDFDSKNSYWYADMDQDGFGDWNNPKCHEPEEDGYILNAPMDCDDNNPNILGPQVYYADNDGDGFGSSKMKWQLCPGEIVDAKQKVAEEANDFNDFWYASSMAENVDRAYFHWFTLENGNGSKDACYRYLGGALCYAQNILPFNGNIKKYPLLKPNDLFAIDINPDPQIRSRYFAYILTKAYKEPIIVRMDDGTKYFLAMTGLIYKVDETNIANGLNICATPEAFANPIELANPEAYLVLNPPQFAKILESPEECLLEPLVQVQNKKNPLDAFLALFRKGTIYKLPSGYSTLAPLVDMEAFNQINLPEANDLDLDFLDKELENELGTNSYLIDSDFDGVDDGLEWIVARGDPFASLNANITPMVNSNSAILPYELGDLTVYWDLAKGQALEVAPILQAYVNEIVPDEFQVPGALLEEGIFKAQPAYIHYINKWEMPLQFSSRKVLGLCAKTLKNGWSSEIYIDIPRLLRKYASIDPLTAYNDFEDTKEVFLNDPTPFVNGITEVILHEALHSILTVSYQFKKEGYNEFGANLEHDYIDEYFLPSLDSLLHDY